MKIYPITIEEVKAIEFNNYTRDASLAPIVRAGKISELSDEDVKEFFGCALPHSNKGIRYGRILPKERYATVIKELNSEYGIITLEKFNKPKEYLDGNIKSRNT